MLLSRESSIREIIRHICVNQEKFTFIFSSLLEESDYINLLQSLCKSAPPKIFTPTKSYPNEIYFQYSANILLNKKNIFEGINLQSYYIYELKKLGKLWGNELFQALTNTTSQFPLTRLSFNLNFLLKKKMPLFRSMKYLFWELLHKFSSADLVKSFGMTIFEMDDQIDVELLSSFDLIKNISNQNISSFLQIPAVLTTDKSSKLIQSLLSCSEPFPGYSKLFKEPNLLTLVNDSLLKRSHFIENILKVGLSYNCNLSKLITLTESCCCSDFLPFYFLLSDGQITEQPIEELSKLDDSHAFYIFKRMYGDRQMTEFFRTHLGTFVPIEKFINESFVFLMSPILLKNVDIDSIINLSNQYFYTISDKDRDIDFDFYFGIRTICLMLDNNYVYKNKEKNNDYFNNYHRIREIKLLLSQIKDKRVIVEIFSALFVKDIKTNKFVCPFDVAEAVITYISSSFSQQENEPKNNDDDIKLIHHFTNDNDYDKICADAFSRALIHLKLGKLLTMTKTRRKKNTELISSNKNSSTSIEPCLMTPTDIISQLLTRGEFDKASDAANDISSKLPHLGAICEIARAIQNTKTFNYSPILSIESQKIYNIEYCISTNIDSDYVLLHYIKEDNSSINDDIRKIIVDRKGKDLKSLFSPIRKLPNLLTSDQFVTNNIFDLPKIERNLKEIYNNVVDENNDIDKNSNCQLKKFLNFIKNFEGKIEIFEVEDLIDSIIKKVDTWNDLESILGENCLIGILPIINNLLNKEKFIKILDQKSHILSTSLCSILNIQPENNYNKVLTNLYLENTKQMKYKYNDLAYQEKPRIKTKNILDIIYQNNEEPNTNTKQSKLEKENIFNIKINEDKFDAYEKVKNSINSILSSKLNRDERVNQLIDFRLMNDDIYIFRCIGFIMDNLPFKDFLDVFPEFRTVEFESIKSEKSSPNLILDQLINENRVSVSINFSDTFNCKDLLIEKLVHKVEELKQVSEKKVTIFLNAWNQLSSEIFEKLPKKSYMNINSQIEILRNENTPINEKHPELPVLEQYPYLNFDNDLLRIFDSKITKGINEGDYYFTFSDDDKKDEVTTYELNSVNSNYFYHYTSLKENSIFNVLDEYANLYLPHFKHYNIIVEKIGAILFDIVNSIFVRSNIGELITIKILEKVLYLLKSVKFSLFKILNASLNSNSFPLSLSKSVSTSSTNASSNASPSANLMASQSASTPLRRGSINSVNESDFISMASFPFEREIKLIECIHQFCELTVYNHFNIEYTFYNFQNKSNLEKPFPLQFFIFVCDQLDFTELLQKFSILWDVDVTELKLNRIENCYKLGQFSDTIQLLKSLGQSSSSLTSSFSAISKEQKERLRNRLQKAVFFDVGDALKKEKLDKIKNYNFEEDIDIELEVNDYLCIRNNYMKINEIIKTVKRSNSNMKVDHTDHLSMMSNMNDNRNSSVNDSQSMIRSSRSVGSIFPNRSSSKIKLNIDLNSHEKVVNLDDMIKISQIRYNSKNGDNYPFFDENVLNELISIFYSPIEKISINSINGNFSKAFRIFFSELPRSQHVVQVVLIEIFFSALNSFKYDELFDYLNKVKYFKKIANDDQHDFNKLLFTDVSNSLRRMKMNQVLCDFLARLEQYEGIITNMIEIIDEDKTWNDLLRHLNIFVDTIQKELKRRSRNEANHIIEDINKSSNLIYSNDELVLLLSKTGVLNNFTRLCIDQKIAYPSTSKTRPNTRSIHTDNQSLFKINNLSILKIKNSHADYASLLSSIEDMAVIALYYEKFNLALQIIELSKLSKVKPTKNWIQPIENNSADSFVIDETSFVLFKVCDTLVDKMNMTKRPLSSYFEKMHQKLDSHSYAILSLALSKVVFGKAVSPRDVPVFIESNVRDLKLQVNILIELGLLNDALRIALRTNDYALIKKLEKQASVYGNMAVKSRCQRFLELNL